MEQKVKSPCIKVCKIDANSGYCIGCKRTLSEISSWLFMSDEEKLKLLEKLKKR